MNDTQVLVQNLVEKLNAALPDATKFDDGNDSAGARVRKALQDVVKTCKDGRNAVQTTREARKAANHTPSADGIL